LTFKKEGMMSKAIFILLVVSVIFMGYVFCGPIHEAAKSGDIKTLRKLLDKDSSLLYVQDEYGKTPLHWATGRHQLEAMKVLVNEYHVDINVRNRYGGTPLHVAASQANPEGAKFLIAHGADVNARANNGATPLHYAALKIKPGHLEAAKILLENGADPNAKMSDGITPLAIASFRHNQKMVEMLRKYGASGSTELTMEQRRHLMYQIRTIGTQGGLQLPKEGKYGK